MGRNAFFTIPNPLNLISCFVLLCLSASLLLKSDQS